MALLIELKPTKTYATRENAIKAVEKTFGLERDELMFFVAQHTDGRFFPVFVGERAIQRMVHTKFNIVA